ncbi:hypothetical protein PV08_00059 [Exophiala spinifera]|uniref:Uncharacterized protein n=1 Tax=Exophiala spinifera TaxID=91928 RepID=A0A0D2A3N9_9EURO|nr:uncharacterized protein PV08_00059 [Exophiala spinifera]KIW19487.1 hypothetical protein PV08_00059 [Exophiala spinifera]
MPALGVHYDQIFWRYDEDTTVTVWESLGDLSRQGRGWIYLDKGRLRGAEIEARFIEKAKASGLTDEEAKSAFNQNMISMPRLPTMIQVIRFGYASI